MTFVVTLPWPPSINTYWRRGPRSTYLSPKGREFKAAVADLVSDMSNRINLDPKARLAVFMGLSAPSRREYDIDNRIKAVLDALQDAGVFEDDEQIDHISVVRMDVSKRGFCSVVITEER